MGEEKSFNRYELEGNPSDKKSEDVLADHQALNDLINNIDINQFPVDSQEVEGVEILISGRDSPIKMDKCHISRTGAFVVFSGFARTYCVPTQNIIDYSYKTSEKE